jgi:hypothetical protein
MKEVGAMPAFHPLRTLGSASGLMIRDVDGDMPVLRLCNSVGRFDQKPCLAHCLDEDRSGQPSLAKISFDGASPTA